MVKERLKLTLEEVFYNLSDEYGEKFNWRLIPLTQSGRGIFIDELKKEIGKNHFLYNKRVWAVAKCESGNKVLYLTGNGVVQGMRPLIGYNYGAGESKRVREIFRSALVLIAGVMVIGTILCMAVPQTLIGLFTSNPETIQFGKEALRLISIGFIASSVSVTVSGALEGLGKGKESLVISVLRYIAVILPLAFILSKILGAAGVWHAFWITEVVVAGISYVICKKEIFQ